MKKRLRLKKVTLRQLDNDETSRLAGGDWSASCPIICTGGLCPTKPIFVTCVNTNCGGATCGSTCVNTQCGQSTCNCDTGGGGS